MEPTDLSPRVQKLRGILKIEDDFDYKEILTQEIIKKVEKGLDDSVNNRINTKEEAKQKLSKWLK